jgi:hypothetical protein
MKALLLTLAWMCLIVPAVRGGMCRDPKGEDGESYQDGCLLHKCKSGVWRPSLDASVCCYNGETYPFNSTITTITSEDSCITTLLECQEDGVKTIITQHRNKKGCSPPASSKQIREIKCMLKQQILEKGCSSSASPEINTSSLKENISGILISGGEGEGALATELFLVGTKQVCTLPPLPHRRFDHSLDVFNQVPVMCGGNKEEGHDENIERSCLQFTPDSDCGTWKNFTTLQEPLWGHTSWISKDGLVFFGHRGDVEMLSFDGKSHIIQEGDLTNKRLFNSGLGWFHMDSHACGIDDEGDSFISTGGILGQTVAVRYNMREKTLLKLPSMNVERKSHGCGMYLDQNGAKVYLVAGGWDSRINYLSTTELLTQAATAWTFSSPLPRALKSMASVSLDNKVFFTGGEIYDWRVDIKERKEILAFDGNSWTEVGQLQIPRKKHAATVVDASNLMGFC